MTKKTVFWVEWVLFVMFKIAIDGMFVVFGPVAIICYWSGFDFAGLSRLSTCMDGAIIFTVISLFDIPDLTRSILLPWVPGGSSLPVSGNMAKGRES